MSALTNFTTGPVVTMSSQAIAELVEKRHDNVKRTIETLAERGVIASPQIEEKPATGGRPGIEYRIGKRDSFVVVAQLSPEFTARLVDRWQQLEAGAAPALNLRQPGQMLAVAMQLAEICQEQAAQLTAQVPKVAFAEAVGDAENLQKVGHVAKALGTGPVRLWAFLRHEKIVMANDLPFQQHLDAGRFKVIEVPYRDRDGAQRIKLETRVTGKGVTFLQQRLAKQQEVSHG